MVLNSILIIIIIAMFLLFIKKQNNHAALIRFYSTRINEYHEKERNLLSVIESNDKEIAALACFAGEALHDQVVKLSNFGENKDVDWLIDMTSKLRMSSSIEKFEYYLKQDDNFLEEKKLVLKEVYNRSKECKTNAKLGVVAFYLEVRLNEYIKNQLKPIKTN